MQKEYDLLSEKLLKLRRDYAIATDTSVKFQLEHQIPATEAELETLAQQQDKLDRVSQDGRLYQALLKLGYHKQKIMFRKFVERYPIAAFLIYGKLDYGQRWLLNRLVVQHTRDSIAGKVIKINLSRVARRNDVAALWRELAGRAGLGTQAEQGEIIDRVHRWWRTQNVLLILYDIDHLPECSLEEILRDFWTPLTTRAWEGGKPESPYKLLMFLVDYDGKVGDWSIPFAETPEKTWHPKIPVKLPVITEFTAKDLANWLEYSADDLPIELVDEVDKTVLEILKNSEEGIPEPTLGEICRQVGLNWYEQEDRWMKL
jgi:inactive STAND